MDDVEQCEWNPTENRPALETDPPHGEATVCLGASGAWHICAGCAELPQFNARKFRVRTPIGSARSSDPHTDEKAVVVTYDLEDYRSRVRSVECPACWVPAGEPCMKIGTINSVDYVHDNRSLAYELAHRRPTAMDRALTDGLRFAGYTQMECACYHNCHNCSLSGEWHVHPGELCPVHLDAPGDH